MSVGLTLFAWTVFPVFLGGSVALAIWQMALEVAPALAFLGPVVASYLGVMLLERALPLHRSWSRPRGDVSVDLGHLVVTGGVTLSLLQPLMLALGVALGGWLSAALGTGLWPQLWPLVAQLVLALLVGEFFLTDSRELIFSLGRSASVVIAKV